MGFEHTMGIGVEAVVPMHKLRLGVEEEGGRQGADAEALADAARSIPCHVEVRAQAGDEALGRPWIVVDGDPEHIERSALVGARELVEVAEPLAAGRAPARPKVEDGNAPEERWRLEGTSREVLQTRERVGRIDDI